MWEGESGEFVHHFAESAYWDRPCPGYHGKGLCWSCPEFNWLERNLDFASCQEYSRDVETVQFILPGLCPSRPVQ